MLAAELNGGLGNQMFQLAAAETIAAETELTFCIMNDTSPITEHTDANYFDSVFSPWRDRPRLSETSVFIQEYSFDKVDWTTRIPMYMHVCLRGYFQNWRYIPADFRDRIRLPSSPPLNGAFLHIRGGDYVNHWLHDINLYHGYYERAVAEFPPDTHFYVFTNDIAYAKTAAFLSNIPHTFVESDELMSLAQMASCTAGGICANSSFSWWGAYLNPNRTIVMPSKWFNDTTLYTEGYYFPGVRKCSV